MICKMAFICCLKAAEWIGIFIMVWKSGKFYFHWTIFFHFFILKPFFANILDCMIFGGVSWGIRKFLMTIWYHLIPIAAFIIYDFVLIEWLENNAANVVDDNLTHIDFKNWYWNWNFYWTLITVFPTSFIGAFVCVYTKISIIKNEGHKMRLKEREIS